MPKAWRKEWAKSVGPPEEPIVAALPKPPRGGRPSNDTWPLIAAVAAAWQLERDDQVALHLISHLEATLASRSPDRRTLERFVKHFHEQVDRIKVMRKKA